MERPKMSGWQITKNDYGVTMATLPAVEIIELLKYAEYAEMELQCVGKNEINNPEPQLQQADVSGAVCDCAEEIETTIRVKCSTHGWYEIKDKKQTDR